MPVRSFNREKSWLLPPSLDELLPVDHPARFVAMIIDSQDKAGWEKLEIKIEGEERGAPNYHPRVMLGVWVYGFMSGLRTSRKLEAACRDQIPFLWLTGWQQPDHNSLWRFYREHRLKMRHLFKLTVKTAVKLNLLDLAVQAIDGTKMGANAARDRTFDRTGLQKLLERTDKRIEELEKENESAQDPAPVHLPEKLRQAEQLRTEVKKALDKLMDEEEDKHLNLTDSETKLVKNRQGVTPGYNLQATVSPVKDSAQKRVLITAEEVVTDANDIHQLIPLIEQAQENCGERAAVSLADAGYHSGENLAECEELKQSVVMPENQSKYINQPYHKDQFTYQPESDSYICPQGQTLIYRGMKKVHNGMRRVYRGNVLNCLSCPAFGICTHDRHNGRELKIGEYEKQLRRHREWMKSEEARQLYRLRKMLIEMVFGTIKEALGMRHFWLRGLQKVRAEAAMMATAFNLKTLFSLWRKQPADHAKWAQAFHEVSWALSS
jgi:transposase